MTADGDKSQEDKKVFDVAKPGKTAASPSGRPLIVSNRSIVKDPMFKDGDKDLESAEKDSNPKNAAPEDKPAGAPEPEPSISAEPVETETGKHITVQPSKELVDEQAEEKKHEQQEEKQEKQEPGVQDSIAEEPPDSKKDEETDAEDHKEKSDEANTSNEAAAISTAAQETENKRKAEQEAQQMESKKAVLEKLIEEKKYFIPIGKAAKRNKWLVKGIIGFAVLVVIIALLAYIMH